MTDLVFVGTLVLVAFGGISLGWELRDVRVRRATERARRERQRALYNASRTTVPRVDSIGHTRLATGRCRSGPVTGSRRES
jgi:hypothetical protein